MDLARRLGIEEKVVFLGRVPHRCALEEIRRAWAVISVYGLSNLTNQVLEALALGTPVISLSDGSTEGILETGQNSLLVSLEGAIDGLAGAIAVIASNASLRTAMGENARTTAEAKLVTWAQRMKVEVSELERLLACRIPRSCPV
jgi:glycosyltransferase involved in cell wall biosynthesis